MLMTIILLVAAMVLAVVLAAMFRGKKRGSFDVKTRNPNEFGSHVSPDKDSTVNKTDFTISDKDAAPSQPVSPNEFSSPIAPTEADNTRVNKNEYGLNDKGEEGTHASKPSNPNEFSSPVMPTDENDLNKTEYSLSDDDDNDEIKRRDENEPPKPV